jgi:Fic family protein
MATLSDLSPCLPSEKTMIAHGLLDKAQELDRKAAKLAGWLNPITRQTITDYMSVINSYYSNLIEGNRTLPHEVRRAQAGDYSNDPAKRDLQIESVAHIHAQRWLAEQDSSLDSVFRTDRLRQIHRVFYDQLPEPLRWVEYEGERVEVIPGELRTRDVRVGKHVPIEHDQVEQLLEQLLEHYRGPMYQGNYRTLAVLAAHHRMLWVHPFLDGNGRVARLWLDDGLKATGIESVGVWCISRGLAKASSEYKMRLQNADAPRQGQTDGRGLLSEKALAEFLTFMIDTAIDQVDYIAQALDLDNLQHRLDRFVDFYNLRLAKGQTPLKPNTSTLLWTAFLKGEIPRNEAIRLTGEDSDRNARRVLSDLRRAGLLTETTHKSPLRWAITEEVEDIYFPKLAPLG